MKVLVFKLIFVLLAAGGCASLAVVAAAAQEATSSGWVKVAPRGEKFSVSMPRSPSVREERKSVEGLRVSGRSYQVKEGGTLYAVWSFKREAVPSDAKKDTEAYLDLCAELAWDLLVRPEIEAVRQSKEIVPPGNVYEMAYRRELPSATYPGRNYWLGIADHRGATMIYLDGERIYLVAALAAPSDSSRPETFMRSFSLGGKSLPDDVSKSEPLVGSYPASRLPVAVQPSPGGGGVGSGTGGGVGPGIGGGAGEGGGIGAGHGGNTGGGTGSGTPDVPPVDYNRTFMMREVTRKALISAKPEPLYTEPARKFNVTGTVRLRLVLRRTGEVGDIEIVRRLPHGLTQKAIEAARGVKFKRAEKDGRYVSQYVTIEYNFNIY